jgi:TRAP-type C4-dicarboxylate transport system permease small subunit
MSRSSLAPARLQHVLDRLDEMLNLIACIALVLMLFAVVLQVITRYAMKDPIGGVIGISEQFLMPLVVFLSLSWVQKHEGHIRVAALWDRLGSRARRIVGGLVNALGALLFAIVTWAVGSEAFLSWQMGYDTSGDISVPLMLALLIPTFGSALLTLRLALGTIWTSADAADPSLSD